MGPRTAAGALGVSLLAADLSAAVPRRLECPAPLVASERSVGFALHPDPNAGLYSQYCRRADGTPDGPIVSWSADRQKLSLLGSYCAGHAHGRWSFFWGNGVLARDGSFTGASLRDGTWTDYDTSGRKVAEILYAGGPEISRREYSRVPVELAIDRRTTDLLATERYEVVLRQPCTSVAPAIRPYHGLRAELRAADAVVVVRPTRIKVDRPPTWIEGLPALPQRVEATVRKVLAGSLSGPGARIELSFAAAEQWKRVETLMGTPEYRLGFNPSSDVTVLVKKNGGGLEVLNLLAANETELTDAFFTEYARLAALDDRGFRVGLARHLAARVRGDRNRLLWVRWAVLAMDDWDRLPRPSPADERAIQTIVRPTLAAVLAQADQFARGGNGAPNLSELPWLIRLLTEPQRRQLARALLRMHPIIQRSIDATGKARGDERPRGPLDELTLEDLNARVAAAAMMHLTECLAACVDPENPALVPLAAVLERARFLAGVPAPR